MFRLVCLAILVAAALPVLAGDPPAAPATPDQMNDVTLYRTFCKSCHGADSEAGQYSPMDLIMDQWDEVFDQLAETHATATLDASDGKPVVEFLGPKLLDRLRAFCIKGAADSEEPMTCG
ncbi:MAG: hypothetical protein R3D98_02925 [Candidatus Krumholzibacteriia bacterium]